MNVSSLKIDSSKQLKRVNVGLDKNSVLVHEKTKYFPLRKLELRDRNEKQILYICETQTSTSVFKTLSLNIGDIKYRATVMLPCVVVRIEGGVLLPLNFERENKRIRRKGLKSKFSLSELSQSVYTGGAEVSNLTTTKSEEAFSLDEGLDGEKQNEDESEETDIVINPDDIANAYETEGEDYEDEDDEDEEEESIFSDMSNITDLGCGEDFDF